MPELLNRISAQLTEWWGRFSNRQRIAIISTVAIAVVALAILVVVLNQPTYVMLAEDLNSSEVNERTALLEGAGITTYEVRDNATSIYVTADSKQDAILALAEVGIVDSSDMTYAEAFNNSITTSNTEAAQKYQLYFQAEIGRKLELITVIEDASVTIVLPDFDSVLFEDQAEAKASIILTTNDTLSNAMVEAVASSVADMVENLEKSNITIIDSSAKLLYDGEARNGDVLSGLTAADYELNQELLVKDKVRSVLLAGGAYNDAIVSVDLVIDYDTLKKTSETHTTADGTNTGILDSESMYTSESENTSAGGSPGTDSNGVTDTEIDSGDTSSATIEEYNRDYVFDTVVTEEIKAIGGAKYDESTVTVTLNKYVYYDQEIEEAKVDGPLATMTWDEYKLQLKNEGNTKIEEVDEDIERLIKNASNIDNVVVLAYEVPQFIDKEVAESPLSDYLLIGIIVVMILLLGYAVYKGTEPVEIKEIEPELSVEDMLTTTKEQTEVDSIEFDGKSEARVQIEQFVENNPDAVALLLRNWLNEDWE